MQRFFLTTIFSLERITTLLKLDLMNIVIIGLTAYAGLFLIDQLLNVVGLSQYNSKNL